MEDSDRCLKIETFNQLIMAQKALYCGCYDTTRDMLENKLTRKNRIKAGLVNLFGCTQGQAGVMAMNYIGEHPMRTRRCRMCGEVYADRHIKVEVIV